MSSSAAPTWPKYYYAATIAFAALDWLGGTNLRAAGLAGSPVLRGAYYAGCLGCGLASHLRPSLALPVTLIESALNIVSLVLSVLMPLYTFDPEAPGAQLAGYPETVTNFIISGSAATAAFYQSLYASRKAAQSDRPGFP